MLLGSAPTLEGIKNILFAFWFDKDISFKWISDKELNIIKSGKVMNDFIIVKKGNRYRFENIKTK